MDVTESRNAVNQVKDWITTNRDELLKYGICTILATYSGEGDSGCLDENIEFVNSQGHPVETEPGESLHDPLEALHEEVAPLGYEDNEGGGGEFCIDIETGAITHESYYLTIERSYNAPEEY